MIPKQRVQTPMGYGRVTCINSNIAIVRLDNGRLEAFRIDALTAVSEVNGTSRVTARCEANMDSTGRQCKRIGHLIPGWGYACYQHAKGVTPDV